MFVQNLIKENNKIKYMWCTCTRFFFNKFGAVSINHHSTKNIYKGENTWFEQR